jgi:hypothetical protein
MLIHLLLLLVVSLLLIHLLLLTTNTTANINNFTTTTTTILSTVVMWVYRLQQIISTTIRHYMVTKFCFGTYFWHSHVGVKFRSTCTVLSSLEFALPWLVEWTTWRNCSRAVPAGLSSYEYFLCAGMVTFHLCSGSQDCRSPRGKMQN